MSMMKSPKKNHPTSLPSPASGTQRAEPTSPVLSPLSPTSISRSLSLSQKQGRDLLLKVLPFLQQVKTIVDKASPYIALVVSTVTDVWEKLQPYHPEDFAPLILGLMLVFFGGMYMTTVAAIEAYRIIGWQATWKGLRTIGQNYSVALTASKKDDEEDLNKDGIADVKQISKDQLVSRKVKLILKSVDPQQVSTALQGISAGLFAVVATLRVRFAQSLALGVALGETLEKHAFPFVNPILLSSVPKEYHKWVPIILSYTCRSVGVSLAWTLQRIISSFHSAIRGSSMFCTSLLTIALKKGWVSKNVVKEGSIEFNAAIAALAAIGIFWQLRSGFSLFFPLNILLLPLTIVEWMFTFFINFFD